MWFSLRFYFDSVEPDVLHGLLEVVVVANKRRLVPLPDGLGVSSKDCVDPSSQLRIDRSHEAA